MEKQSAAQKRQSELIEIANKVLIRNYRQQPMVMTRGKGSELWDVAGRRYLDMTAGIAVCALGHANSAMQRALSEQADRLLHTSNLYHIEMQIRAAKAITSKCFGDRVFFCNSGAEANEGALKLARRYQHQVAKKPDRNLIVACEGSFHGRSIATVSITGQAKYREGFGPLFGPVEFVPFGDLAAAEKILGGGQACAFIVEPVQGEGGIVVPPEGYLRGLRELCDRTGTVLIYDEVQTGVGRTGHWFAHQWEKDASPDVMSLAKGLGGGVPVGAVVVSEKAGEGLAFVEGSAVAHATTFGGNPLACAAAVSVIEEIDRQGVLEVCQEAGSYLGKHLESLAKKHSELCVEARGRGLLRGLALKKPASPYVTSCREHGVLLSVAGGSVVRFAPALNVSHEHIDEAVSVLDAVLSKG